MGIVYPIFSLPSQIWRYLVRHKIFGFLMNYKIKQYTTLLSFLFEGPYVLGS